MKKNKVIFISGILAILIFLFLNSKDIERSDASSFSDEKILADSDSSLSFTANSEKALRKPPALNAQESNSKSDVIAQTPPEAQEDDFTAVNVSAVPKTLLAALGSKSREAWDHLSSMSFEEAKKSSSFISFANKTKEKQIISTSESSKAQGPQPDKAKKKQFIHWGKKTGCKVSDSMAGSVPVPEEMHPPKCVGFFARTYNENHELLKQTFIPANLEDPLGCQYYEVLLQDLLPADKSEEQFNGFLSLTTAMGEQHSESQEIWLNLDKPKGLATNLGE